MPEKKKISIITAVFNEELNVRRCYETVKSIFDGLSDTYSYEHVFGDNCSSDGTLAILRDIAKSDPNVKVLAYSRNFGAEKSSLTLIRHVSGDAMVGIPADLQEPPEVIPTFLEQWEKGHEIVCGIYENRSDAWLMVLLRKLYYWLVAKFAQEDLDRDYSGFGLLDRKVIEVVADLDDFDPYLRGVISTIGFNKAYVPYQRQPRKRGKSKHGFSFLFGFALNGLISHSMLPIRLATFTGMLLSGAALLAAVGYAIIKLFFWRIYAPGAATTIVLVLFFSGIQLFFLGVLGEYIGAIHSQVRRRPFVIIKEKINFAPKTSD